MGGRGRWLFRFNVLRGCRCVQVDAGGGFEDDDLTVARARKLEAWVIFGLKATEWR